jgi:hypothetical protein
VFAKLWNLAAEYVDHEVSKIVKVLKNAVFYDVSPRRLVRTDISQERIASVFTVKICA